MRTYPVCDRVTAQQVLETVQTANPPNVTGVHRMQWRDLGKIDIAKFVIAVNPVGRQSYVVLTSLGGRSASFLVHAFTNTVELIPLRFAKNCTTTKRFYSARCVYAKNCWW